MYYTTDQLRKYEEMMFNDIDKNSAKLKYDTELNSYLYKSGIGEYQLCKEAEVAAYEDLTSAIFNTRARSIDRDKYQREIDSAREKHEYMEKKLNSVVSNLKKTVCPDLWTSPRREGEIIILNDAEILEPEVFKKEKIGLQLRLI